METKSIRTTDREKLVEKMNKNNVNKRNIILFEHKDTEFICIYQKYNFGFLKRIKKFIYARYIHIIYHCKRFKKGDIIVDKDGTISLYDGNKIIWNFYKGIGYGFPSNKVKWFSIFCRKANKEERERLFSSIKTCNLTYIEKECKIVNKDNADK